MIIAELVRMMLTANKYVDILVDSLPLSHWIITGRPVNTTGIKALEGFCSSGSSVIVFICLDAASSTLSAGHSHSVSDVPWY
jgi:hypothetical protein